MAGSISSSWKGQPSKLRDLPTGFGKREGKKIERKKKARSIMSICWADGQPEKDFS